MANEKCLKKSFKDTLEDIKERMKEKRNQRLAKLGRSYVLGKPNSILSSKGKIADDSSVQLKNFQANNRALALALEEEKSKMREAQDIILYLKREYQSLKFQMLVLQRKVELQEEKEHVETRLLMVKKIISKAVQNLLEATNLLDPAKDLYTTEDSQHFYRVPALEECDSSHGRNQAAMAILKPDFAVTVNKQGKTFTSELEDNADKNYLDYVSDSWQDVENISTGLPLQTNKGWRNSSYEDCQPYESGNTSSSEENKQVANSLPKSVSIRRRCLRNQDQNEFCISDGNNLEITDQIKESCEQDITRSETDLENKNEQFEVMHHCAENIYDTNRDQSLASSYMPTESSTSTTDLKETDFNSRGDSQKERGQKRKLEEAKNRSRTRSKKKSQNKRSCPKEKAGSSTGSSDAYDFIFEESVHITPFRQNKENENIEYNTSYKEELCSDLSSDDNSDDSLYVPYENKSKSRKTLSHGSDAASVCTRQQFKNTVSVQHERTIEGKMSFGKPEELPKNGHLGDITNLTSSSTKTRDSHPPIFTNDKDSSHQKRRCTVSMCYKEPPINRKLRRGDPFTDTGFLTSPIFKDKKSSKYKSVKKRSMSRYNEAFVGSL